MGKLNEKTIKNIYSGFKIVSGKFLNFSREQIVTFSMYLIVKFLWEQIVTFSREQIVTFFKGENR